MAKQALSQRPWYRPAVQAAADLTILQGRDEEALALLTEADKYIECAAIVGMQISMLMRQQRYSEAWDRLERMSELTPLMESEVAEGTNSTRSDIAYYLNDIETAIEFGRKSGSPFLERTAERLADPGRKKRSQKSEPANEKK